MEEHRFQEAAAVMMNRGNALVGWLSAESRDRTEAVFQKIKDQTNQIVALATEHHAEVSKAVFALLDASPALKAYAKSRCMSSTHWKDEEDRR
ncbi:cell division protein FtsZ [Alicyclobacillus hesperidum URH17-3-68]|nr:cell division protein FtsZ [Alicyclobacillus hesperidum URH17-3-68]